MQEYNKLVAKNALKDYSYLRNNKKSRKIKVLEKEVEIDFTLKELLNITFAVFLIAVGIYFFKFPNKISTGGVSGIAIIVTKFINITPALVTVLFNMTLLLIGFLVLGKSFGIKTAYASIVLSGFIYIFEKTIPIYKPLTNEPMLELVFAILLPGLGAAMLFNVKASSGGTDVIAMIIKKYTHKDIGNALFLTDIIIAVSILFVYGAKSGLLSIVGLIFKAVVVNAAIESFNRVKYFTIITSKYEEVNEYITNILGRGLTHLDATGGFKEDKKTVILTVVSNNQAAYLNSYIKKIDPTSFVMISNISNIIGNGFKSMD